MKRKKISTGIRLSITIIAAAIITLGSCYMSCWLTVFQRNLEISGIRISDLNEIKYIPIVIIIALIIVIVAIPKDERDKTE